MLSELRINNIAIIKETAINFDDGLNVLTGETGAGKSIIIDSINAILGERTSRELIRTGSSFADVSALFTDISTCVKNAIDDIGILNETDGSLLITRKMSSDGKNICKINGQTVTVSMLKKIGESLINVHGQLDNHNLLNDELHYTYIDKFAENDALKDNYLKCYFEYNELKKKYKSLITDESEKQRKLDLLNYQINEIDDADIKIGEKKELESRRKALQNIESIVELLNNSLNTINGDDNFKGAGEMLNFVPDCLIKASQFDDSLSKLSDTLSDISYSLTDCASELSDILYNMDSNPNELYEIEDRLNLIYNLSKKYVETEEEILKFSENAKKELDSIIFADKIKDKYEENLKELYVKMEESAKILSDNRKKYSAEFIDKISEELSFLDMSSVTFKVVQNEKEFDENGKDEIYFLISANKGEDPKPLTKIASGGELSRIMLAIKNVLAQKDKIDTLIFDEIDTGVSGRAAQKIGIKLKEVSKNRQVLCVTHLAQIAAFADNHYKISKSEKDGKTYTNVELLNYDGKVSELARIMGGIDSTKLSLDAASELIENSKKYS